MQFLKSLMLLLVSVNADPGGNSFPYAEREPRSDTVNKSSRRGESMAHHTHIDFISLNPHAHPNRRTLREKENLKKSHDKEARERRVMTHRSLEQKRTYQSGDNGAKHNDAPKRRHLRHLVQSITAPKSEPCTGTRKIVQCKDSVPESVCKEDLIKSGVQVLSDMPKTVFFAICVDSEADAAIVAALTNVEGVEDDPPRTLSVVKGSLVKRNLQAFQQVTPYGIDMVNAPEFWSRYDGNQGSGIKVCVIDTGLLLSHEDIRDADVSGSDGAGLLSPVSYVKRSR